VWNELVYTDIFKRIVPEVACLNNVGDSCTLKNKEIQTSVWLVLPSDLTKYEVSEGGKAAKTFILNKTFYYFKFKTFWSEIQILYFLIYTQSLINDQMNLILLKCNS
jgi:hypothetical protein